MPYYYDPTYADRILRWLHLHRWCRRCHDWVWVFHIHRHRRPDRRAGFTLIELLIVVAIIGIISAIAIPNLLNAVDQSKQKRTMADIRAIGQAVEAYAVDMTRYPTASDLATLETLIKPVYIRVWPGTDGWNNPLIYVPEGAGRGYTVKSTGKDGVVEASPAGGGTGDFDCDILFIDGRFLQWPESGQQ